MTLPKPCSNCGAHTFSPNGFCLECVGVRRWAVEEAAAEKIQAALREFRGRIEVANDALGEQRIVADPLKAARLSAWGLT